MQTGEMDLSDNFNANLIELVRKRTCLYNKQNKSYFDNNFKNAAWMEIANKLNRSPEECKTRWKHLRETFVKNNKRKLSGIGTREDTWPYFQSMSFLASFVHPRRTKRNKRIITKGKVRPTYDPVEVQKEETSPYESEREHSVSSRTPESPPPKHKRTRRESTLKTTNDIVEYFNIGQDQASKNNDHIYSFFKAMADSVVNLPLELQLNVKQQIFSVVVDAEYENIKPKPSTSSEKRSEYVRSTSQQQRADTSSKYNILCENLLQASECIDKEEECM